MLWHFLVGSNALYLVFLPGFDILCIVGKLKVISHVRFETSLANESEALPILAALAHQATLPKLR